jgi:hypothetical protein
MVAHILERDVDAVQDHVEENVNELDLKELVQVEEQNQNREELVHWLLQKAKRRNMIEDEERVQELLSHIEHAYRMAAISEETYAKAKQANKDLLQNN